MHVDRTQSQWLIDKREAVAEQGMITAMHPLAALAGLEILHAGGNAVDAAVATAFAIGVVEPAMSGVGGVAAMVIYSHATGRSTVVDGSSAAPTAARGDMFELAPETTTGGMYGWRGTVGDAQNTGYRAPVVPGQPACLLYAHERYGSGRISRAQVMAPAIRLAEDGYPVDPYQAQTIAFAQRRLRAFPETLRTFFPDDGLPPVPTTSTRDADRLVQPDLARTLRALAEYGPSALYEGEIGERLVADLQAHGGVITRGDLASYAVREYSPLQTDYRGFRLLGLSPTSGSMTAFEALNILGNFDMRAMTAGTASALHLIAEALRHAFVDRFAYLADTDMEPVPVEALLSADYARAIAATIDPQRADPHTRAGDAWQFQPAFVGARRAVPASQSAGGEGCTTHINVIDSQRNMVACTSTLGELFGSAVVARGTGIVLNNGMTWFDPEPGRVNSIASRKRTLWAPTPTLVLRDGQPFLAIGAPGGRRIISALVQSLVNVLDFGLPVQAAVTAPRIHCEGPLTEVDGRTDQAVVDALAGKGHQLKLHEENSSSFRFARPGGIRVDPDTQQLTAGVHQFTPAWAMGY
ncbi:MAG: gamma-glutamyltransferase [Chloroflexi bacterium]|nr:MAG: gamma-glutamyltransferase [Chloroflexota bacterium]